MKYLLVYRRTSFMAASQSDAVLTSVAPRAAPDNAAAALAAPHNARGSFPSSRFVAPTHCTPQHMPRTNAAARSARASPIPVSKS